MGIQEFDINAFLNVSKEEVSPSFLEMLDKGIAAVDKVSKLADKLEKIKLWDPLLRLGGGWLKIDVDKPILTREMIIPASEEHKQAMSAINQMSVEELKSFLEALLAHAKAVETSPDTNL